MTETPPETLSNAKEQFAAALKAYRKKRQLKQPQAAQTFGVPLDTYRKWEQAAHAPVGLAWDAAWKILLNWEGKR